MPYAEETRVPVGQSKNEIEKLLLRYGATRFASGWEGKYATLMFRFDIGSEHGSRAVRIRFGVPTEESEPVQRRREQEERRIWRAALLVIKAKLESVESGIETFEQAWLAHVVVPGGKTVGETVIAKLQGMYRGGPTVPLLGSGE